MLNDFDIIEKVGKGGMGCVYHAVHKPSGRHVALKMMSNSMTCYPEYRELFSCEVETLRLMDHPSVVHIIGESFNDSAGNLYLPMEFVEGQTIETIVKGNGNPKPFSPNEAMRIMINILKAIEYVHDRGKIHRDIKPSNIMVRPDGSICVIDFGIAKDSRVGSSGKTIGIIIGTDGYMSPEQAQGYNIDSRTDIYSLGCLMFFMLTARDAVKKESNNYQTRLKILNAEMVPPSSISPGIPARLDEAYLKSVDKNMMKRFQTAREFRKCLEKICGGVTEADEAEWTVEIGKSRECDIILNNDYVSRKHLTIYGLRKSDGTYSMLVKDHSTNGVGMNGRRYHKETVTEVDYPCVSFPNICLAGRADLTVDWEKVVAILQDKGWGNADKPPSSRASDNPPAPVYVDDEELPVALKILCFLIPLAGIITSIVYYGKSNEKAKGAIFCAVSGIIFSIIITAIISH